jgi:prepilin-type N-terminal cleavage/methylation domain-containing protein
MARPAPDAAGFTLVELMVALVVGGVLAGVIVQFLGGQVRFVEMQSAREELQQNARVVVDLIGSELRTVPPGDGLEMAHADSLTLRVPRVWGVVCTASAGAMTVAIPRLTGVGYAVNDATHAVVDVRGAAAVADWSNPVRVTAVGASAAPCAGALGATAESRALTLSGTPSIPTSPTSGRTPVPGDVVYLFDRVTYRVGSSGNAEGNWVQRRIGGGGNQPMAGPIVGSESAGGSGLRFLYFAGAAGTPLPAPLDQTQRRAVSQVTMVVRTRSRAGVPGAEQAQEDTVVISLRNRVAP